MVTQPSISELARIKIELLRSGLNLNASLDKAPFLDVIFPKGVWTSFSTEDFNSLNASYELVQEQEFSYLVNSSGRVQVEVRRNPDFYNQRSASGKPFGKVASIRANYVEIFPEVFHEGSEINENDVLEVVRRSLESGWAEYVSFYDDSNFGEERIERILGFVKVIKRHLDTHISFTAEPPSDVGLVNAVYGSGVDSISYNLFYVDEEDRAKQRYRVCMEALKHAVGIFSTGSVASLIYLDERNDGNFSETIQTLTRSGIFPVLSYRTAFGRRSTRPLELGKAAKLYRQVAVALRRSRFKLGWVPHSSVVVQSVDPIFFLDRGFGIFVRNLMRTATGSRLAFGIGALRRKLRVRER